MILAPLIVAYVATVVTATPFPDDVAVSVLHQLLSNRPETSDKTLCLLVDGKDPSTAILTALKLPRPGVLVGSACHYEDVGDRTVVAKTQDGLPAEFLRLSGFTPTLPGEAEITYWYRAGSWTGSGRVVKIQLVEGQWVFSKSGRYIVE